MDKSSAVPLVLIADDYPDLAELMSDLLTTLAPTPLEIRLAFDGAQAVKEALERPPHVVILDIDMPVLSGLDAAKHIRAALTPTPVLVAVTGNPTNIDMLRKAAVFDHVLAKPVETTVLLSLIPSP